MKQYPVNRSVVSEYKSGLWGQWGVILEVWEAMQRRGVVPNVIIYNALVSTCGKGQLPEQALDMALELVEDHHGEFAHDPPSSEVLIVGLEPTGAVFGVLREWGFIEIQSRAEGLLGKKAT